MMQQQMRLQMMMPCKVLYFDLLLDGLHQISSMLKHDIIICNIYHAMLSDLIFQT